MDYAILEQRLIETVTERSKVLIIIIIFITISLLMKILHLCITKTNAGVTIWMLFTKKTLCRLRLTTKQQIVRDVAILAILITSLVYIAFPICRDVKNQQYVKIEAVYSREKQTSDGNLFSYGHVSVKNNGTTIFLELPCDWSEAEFPLGEYVGTIWYSEESKVILAFIPQ